MHAEDGVVTRNCILSEKKGDYEPLYQQFDRLRRRRLRQRGSLRLRSVAACDALGRAVVTCGSDVCCLRRTSPLAESRSSSSASPPLVATSPAAVARRKKEEKVNRHREEHGGTPAVESKGVP